VKVSEENPRKKTTMYNIARTTFVDYTYIDNYLLLFEVLFKKWFAVHAMGYIYPL